MPDWFVEAVILYTLLAALWFLFWGAAALRSRDEYRDVLSARQSAMVATFAPVWPLAILAGIIIYAVAFITELVSILRGP